MTMGDIIFILILGLITFQAFAKLALWWWWT